MAIKKQATYAFYTAWTTSDNTPKTGDAANHTIRIVRDANAAQTPTNTPTEVDATNLPGVYRLLLTAAEMDANSIAIGGKSTTANVQIMPTYIVTERGFVSDSGAGKRIKLNTPSGGDVATIEQYDASGTVLQGTWHFTLDGSNNLVKTWTSA